MNGHAQNLAKAVLLYFGETTARHIQTEWRIVTGSSDYSGTTLLRLARRLLDAEAVAERASKQGKKPNERSDKAGDPAGG